VNGDLLNDGFKIEGIGEVLDFSMTIFNRWGEEIYSSNDPKKAWDGSYQGTYVQDGVYTYVIQFKYFDGKSYKFRGTLTVLR
jgi:gliding motility-associated-like protein